MASSGVRKPYRDSLPRHSAAGTIALDPEQSTAIFRIFQESLTNVARHAHATRVEARLEREADQLMFQVHDNGSGVDPEEAKARSAVGLVGLRVGAPLINGERQV